MACACKVNRDLAYIQKKYGVKGKEQPKTDIRSNFKFMLMDILLLVLCIALSPIILLVIIFMSKNKVLSIKKLYNLMVNPFNRKKKNE